MVLASTHAPMLRNTLQAACGSARSSARRSVSLASSSSKRIAPSSRERCIAPQGMPQRCFSMAASRAGTQKALCKASHANARRSERRAVHSLPQLPLELRNTTGCEPLFSETTVKLLWEDWHAGLLNKLNDEARGTEWENSSLAETVLGTALDPHAIQIFNYASMALNNGFFMSGLKAKVLPTDVTSWEDVPPPQPSISFLNRIEKDFDSLPAFKLAFSSMAYGMAGSGYIWLVQDAHGVLGIVPTHGAGTVLVQNRMQRRGSSPEWTQASIVEGEADTLDSSSGSQYDAFRGGLQAGSMSQKNEATTVNKRGEELYPLLCLSVHERDWLPDYGMWGKEEYLMRFWECVDWVRVQKLHEAYNYSS